MAAMMTITPSHQTVDKDGSAQVRFVVNLIPGLTPETVQLRVEPLWYQAAAAQRYLPGEAWASWLSGWAAAGAETVMELKGPVSVRLDMQLPEGAFIGDYHLKLTMTVMDGETIGEEQSVFFSLAVAARRRELVRLLPDIFQRTYGRSPNVLSAYLGAMTQLHQPSEAILDNLDSYFDAERAPDAFMPFLASWVNMEELLEPDGTYLAGMECLRNLILSAVMLAKWRGTQQGLVKFLEIATGVPGYHVTESTQQAFHIIVTCPFAAVKLQPLINRVVEREKPAFVTYELRFRSGVQADRRREATAV